MINNNVILSKSPNIVSKVIDNDYLLIPVVEDTMDMNNIYGITEVGAFIWDNIDSKNTINDIIKKVIKEYDITKEIASADVTEFLNECLLNNILTQA